MIIEIGALLSWTCLYEWNNLTQFLCQVSQLFKGLLNTERGKGDKNVLLFWEINMI